MAQLSKRKFDKGFERGKTTPTRGQNNLDLVYFAAEINYGLPKYLY